MERCRVTTRIAFQTAMRAAAVALLTDYKADRGIPLQIYPARPRTVVPPCAFVDRLRERVTFTGATLRQRVPSVEVVVLHGLFDSKDAADQRDEFVDGFTEWVLDNYHAAGANTLIGAVETEDDPSYVPDWQPQEVQRSYYATRITLEGLALD
jgi:hypothetical protein